MGRAQHGQNYRGRPRYVDNYRNDFRRGNFRETQLMEVSIIELDIQAIIEMTTLEEAEVGLGKDSIKVTLEGMIKAVVVDQDQV